LLAQGKEAATLAVPGLAATVAPPSARLGETVQLTLTYRLPEGSHLPKTLEIGGLDGLTVLDRHAVPGKIVLKLLVDQLDTWKTRDLTLRYLDREGHTQDLSTTAVSVSVLSNLGEKPEEQGLRPIQDIVPTRSPWLDFLPWMAGFLGLVALALGLFWWRKKRRIDEIRAEILDPPHIRAQKELAQLTQENLFETGQVKRFYFRFSEILRRYLGAIRGFRAIDLTTEEIAGLVRNDLDRTMVDLLKQSDLVKFADAVPTKARKEKQVLDAFAFIEKTRPVEPNAKIDQPHEGAVS
jgi:hypothetical protein